MSDPLVAIYKYFEEWTDNEPKLVPLQPDTIIVSPWVIEQMEAGGFPMTQAGWCDWMMQAAGVTIEDLMREMFDESTSVSD